jgi:hypothetical protein
MVEECYIYFRIYRRYNSYEYIIFQLMEFVLNFVIIIGQSISRIMLEGHS